MFNRDRKTKEKPSDQANFDAKALIAKHLPGALQKVSTVVGIAGVGSVTLAALVAFAQSGDPGALEFVKGLSINWISTWVLNLINTTRKGKIDETELKEAAAVVGRQLTDDRLGEIFRKLDLTEAALRALANVTERSDFATDMVKSQLATREEVLAAINRSGVTVHGDLKIAGDWVMGNKIVNNTGAAEDLSADITAYKKGLVSKLYSLPISLDNRAARDKQLTVMGVFTPLDTTRIPRNYKATTQQKLDDMADTQRRLADAATMVRSQDELLETIGRVGHESQYVELLDILNSHPRAVVLGGPGSGKSTVLRVLALGLCEPDSEFNKTWHHTQLLPIYIELRKLTPLLRERADKGRPAALNADGIRDALLDYVQQRVFRNSKRLGANLNQWLNQRGALWLLDGLDEVPDDWRDGVRDAISLLIEMFTNCRYVIACRIKTYEASDRLATRDRPDPAEFEVQAFSATRQNQAVIRYYDEMQLRRAMDEHAVDQYKKSLTDELQDKPYLRDMAATPLLMGVIAQVHYTEGQLPTGLCELLDRAIVFLLAEWEEQRLREDEDAPSVSGLDNWMLTIHRHISANRADFQDKLCRLAYESYERQSLDIKEAELADAIEALLVELRRRSSGAALPSAFNKQHVLDYLRNRSGILNDDGGTPRVFKFPHKVFHEYMAARWKDREYAEVGKKLVADEKAFEWWRNVYELMAIRGDAGLTADAVRELWPCDAPPISDMDHKRLMLAGEIWRNKPVNDDTRSKYRRVHESVEAVRAQLFKVMLAPDRPAKTRAEAGNLVGRLGLADLQPEVTDVDRMNFCGVPAGLFTLGSRKATDGLAFYDEEYGMDFDIPYGYAIAQYPVSKAQFDVFTAQGGYSDKDFWTEAENLKRWSADQGVRRYNGWASKPHPFGEPFDLPNHPVVGVCWCEALAFTRWLTKRGHELGWLPGDWIIDLPREAEWEKAARGGLRLPSAAIVQPAKTIAQRLTGPRPDPHTRPNPNPARRYAFSDDRQTDDADPERMNYDDTGLRSTSAVGAFAAGRSPYGCEDMNGNVLEWCGNALQNYGPGFQLSADYAGTDNRMLRGGAWLFGSQPTRCAFRFDYDPFNHSYGVGFRVVGRSHSH